MRAIVVLGAKVHPDGRPSGALRARVEKGVELFLRGRGEGDLLVFTGGNPVQGRSEARHMHLLAAALGVPSDACVLEEESRSTLENARHTAALLRERGLHRVLLVTDAFHLFRATRLFWRYGIHVEPHAASLTGREVPLRTRLRWRAGELASLARRPYLLWQRPPSTSG